MRKPEASTRIQHPAVPADKHALDAVPDMADTRSTELHLQALRREFAQAIRQTTMGAITASIAHDVNQPLSAIVTNANAALRWLARAEPDLDEVRAILRRIINDGHRASEVVAGIRSMFEKGRGEKVTVSVNDLVGEVLGLVRDELEVHQVSLRNEMVDGLPQVMAERAQLQQALFNLIMNAVDAMNSVTDRNRILTIRSDVCDSDHVLIALEDTGTGIDPDHMDHIFEAFFTTKAHGMGMGLSICRSVIESHGGRLWALPRHPHGSAFFVKLPSAASGGALGG
jgi:C4-dicarboxylate-specific signal transduction histidine kinase